MQTIILPHDAKRCQCPSCDQIRAATAPKITVDQYRTRSAKIKAYAIFKRGRIWYVSYNILYDKYEAPPLAGEMTVECWERYSQRNHE